MKIPVIFIATVSGLTVGAKKTFEVESIPSTGIIVCLHEELVGRVFSVTIDPTKTQEQFKVYFRVRDSSFINSLIDDAGWLEITVMTTTTPSDN